MNCRACVFLSIMIFASISCATPDEKGTERPIQRVVAPTNDTERWLDSVVMTNVGFYAANCVDCLECIQDSLDKYAALHKTTAPRFVCDIETSRYLLDRTDGVTAAPLPTFTAKQIPAYRVMLIVGEICDIRFTVTPELIVVQKKGISQPLPGNIRDLREPPSAAPHGQATNGLSLALWSEKPAYELNSRMNVWMILSNTNGDATGRAKPDAPAIHKDNHLTITDEDGKETKIKGLSGMVAGFKGGISAQLHENIRRPGVYKLQWKIGAMESNVIEIKVVLPKSETQGNAQPPPGN